MHLTELPIEILIIIIKKLDLKSLQIFYNTCTFSRDVIRMHRVLKNCNVALSPFATVQYMTTSFFKDVSRNIVNLDLRYVVDLCKTAILPALKRMKSLETLDVSYTNITLLDFYDMYKACPSIKNLCINVRFDKAVVKETASEIIEKYQSIFMNMNNVHFVGSSIDIIYSDLVLHLLSKADLNILKLSILFVKPYSPILYNRRLTDIVKFNELYIYFLNMEANYGNYNNVNLIQSFTTPEYEQIIIANGNKLDQITVSATPIFKTFFHDKFNIDILDIRDFEHILRGNFVYMFYNKKTVVIDSNFLLKLHKRVRNYFPFCFESNSQLPAPKKYDWFYSAPQVTKMKVKDYCDDDHFKRRRVGHPNYIVDLDAIFKEKETFELTLAFSLNYVNPVTLSPNCQYLPKLTNLSLKGTVQLTVEFFNVLFTCCTNLVTLDLVASPISTCVPSVSRSIKMSKSLKNIRVIDHRFNFVSVFAALSKCKTLENIHLVDQSLQFNALADPRLLFEKCDNLYNICVKARMTDTVKVKTTRLFKEAKAAVGKPQINFSFSSIVFTIDQYGWNYDPSLEVFNVFPIKPLPSIF